MANWIFLYSCSSCFRAAFLAEHTMGSDGRQAGRQAGEARVVHRTRASGKVFGKRKREETTEKWAVGSDAQWFLRSRRLWPSPNLFVFGFPHSANHHILLHLHLRCFCFS
ncbi:hypothetical protein BKA81DRAFT_194690 [Phyllosticta paracitricarpa]